MSKVSGWRFFAPVLAVALVMWAIAFSLGCHSSHTVGSTETNEAHSDHDGHDHGSDEKAGTVNEAWAADNRAISADPEGELKKALATLKANGNDSDAAMKVWRIAQYDIAKALNLKDKKKAKYDEIKDYLVEAKSAAKDINFDVREMLYEETARVAFAADDLDTAEKAANDLLEAFKDPEQWVYGNAVHEGNMILGQVAAARKDFDAAAQFLVKAGKTPGSPQLKMYGPQFPLALTLERHGKQAEVAQYLESIRSFWKTEHAPIGDWIKELKASKAPTDDYWKLHTQGL